jgi:hypothetical protein
MSRRWLILVCMSVPASSVGQVEPPRQGPGAVLAALEDRLLAADGIRFEFEVTAEGAIEADLRGMLEASAGEVRLTAAGSFAGQAVDLTLLADGDRLELGNGPELDRIPTPAYLNEALVIGLTRMGILHNLARLTGGTAPDHAGGGIRDWVTVGAVTADADTIAFDLTVAGEPAGSAALQIDSGGRPVLRRQTVEFSTGQMRVVERYSAFTIDE